MKLEFSKILKKGKNALCFAFHAKIIIFTCFSSSKYAILDLILFAHKMWDTNKLLMCAL